MKIVSWNHGRLVLLAIALGWATLAAADDGFYLGVEGGPNFASKEKFEFHRGDTLLGAGLDGTIIGSKSFKDGWVAGLVTGYAFHNCLRPELEFAYRHDKFDKGDALQGLLFPSSQTEGNLHGKQITTAGFANLWCDFLKGGSLHPYLGGGAGYGKIDIKHPSYDGADADIHGDDDSKFIWQGGAGLGYDISPHWMASLDYRYVKSDKAKFNLVSDSGGSYTSTHYEANSGMASIRYFFGGAEAAPLMAAAPVEPVAVVAAVSICADGRDNDGDGKIDYPADPGCSSATDEDETDPPQCSDGLDNDGDGLVDFPADKGCASAEDNDETNPCKAPAPGERVSLAGCGTGDVIVLKGVNFDFDKSTLTPNARTILDNVSEELGKYPAIAVEVGGHTDAKGSDGYNQKLSERRAKSVVTYLKSKGVAASRMTAVGYGESKPIADNATDDGRESNRRVELKILAGVAGAAAGAAAIPEGTAVAPLSESAPAGAPATPAAAAKTTGKRGSPSTPPADDESEDAAS